MKLHLRAGAGRTMPWKNGGGSTTELWVDPPAADLAAFERRLSIAEVHQTGPFSSYPGVDRTIVLLGGSGMVLDFGPHGRVRLDRPWEPVSFSGDWPAEGRLLGGPCRDFNVMSRRDRWRHAVTLLRLAEMAPLPAAPTLAVFVLGGAARVAGMRLATGDTALLEGSEGGTAAPEAPGTALLCVAFHPASG